MTSYAMKAVFFKLHKVVRLAMITALFSFVVCYGWDNLRRQEKVPGSKSFLYWVFIDLERIWALLTTCLTFTLGFYNSNAYSRWWKLRVLCGDVLGRSIDTSVMICGYFSSPESEAVTLRNKLIRYLNLAHQLLIFQIRDINDFKSLKAESLATDAEIEIIEDADCSKYNVVYGWFLREVYSNLDLLHSVKEPVLLSFQTNVTKIRGAAADIGMYMNCPIPKEYVDFLAVMVYATIAITPVALVVKIHWTAPPVVFLMVFFYYGFFIITHELADPFNNSYEGFSLDGFKSALSNTGIQLRKSIPYKSAIQRQKEL